MPFGKSKHPDPDTKAADADPDPESPPPYTIVCPEQNNGILLSTVGDFPGYDIVKIHGVVYGTTVRRSFRSFKTTSVRNTGKEYHHTCEAYKLTSLVQDAREEAVDRMVEGVKATGANAAYGFRFDSEVMGEFGELSQVCCCATAVTVVPKYAEK